MAEQANKVILKLQRPISIDAIEVEAEEQGPILCYNEDRSILFESPANAEVLALFAGSGRKVKTFAYAVIDLRPPQSPGARGLAIVEWFGQAPWQEW